MIVLAVIAVPPLHAPRYPHATAAYGLRNPSSLQPRRPTAAYGLRNPSRQQPRRPDLPTVLPPLRALS